MNCPICGAPLEEGARFCSNCGVKVSPETAVPPAGPGADGSYQPQSPVVPPAAWQTPEPLPVSASPVRQALRRTLSSPIFLLLAVLLTCQLAVTLYSTFTGARANDPTGSSTVLGISTVIVCLPLVLYTVGTWLMWGTSKGDAPLKGPGAVRTASIIMVVLMSIVLAVFAIALALIGAAWSKGRESLGLADGAAEIRDLIEAFDGSFTLFLIASGLILLMIFLVLLYFAKMARLAGTIRETDGTGLLSRRIPAYLNFVHGLMIVIVLGSLILMLAASGGLKALLEKYHIFEGLTVTGAVRLAVDLALPLVLFLAIRSLKKNLKNAA